ncbi:MAG: Smr/MutS family protein [Desulfatibacillum sp.]|nr:Smr/MutS family protein [Desulfatibacillum sp.]
MDSPLHEEEFSIHAHIDLHGLDSSAAQELFDNFFAQAVSQGKCTLLFIHDRGLSSPGKPVLKSKVSPWLIRRTAQVGSGLCQRPFLLRGRRRHPNIATQPPCKT